MYTELDTSALGPAWPRQLIDAPGGGKRRVSHYFSITWPAQASSYDIRQQLAVPNRSVVNNEPWWMSACSVGYTDQACM